MRRTDDVGNLGEQQLAHGECEPGVAMADLKLSLLIARPSHMAPTIEVGVGAA